MLSELRKNKGIVISTTVIVGGLFAIALTGFLYWLFLNRMLEMHVAIEENTNERHAINLANVLISSEKIAYEKEGKIMRGVLDIEKLDRVFVKGTDFISNVGAFIQPKDIGIGYPNSFNEIRVIDLEKCDSSNNCEGWMAFLSGPISLEGLPVTTFASCLAEHAKPDIGFIFRKQILGILGLWQPWDLKNCVQNTIPNRFESFFSSSQISSDGFPVLIKYPTGELHTGRISVWVAEWA